MPNRLRDHSRWAIVRFVIRLARRDDLVDYVREVDDREIVLPDVRPERTTLADHIAARSAP